MENIEYYLLAVTLVFIVSITVSMLIVHRKIILEIIKIVFAHAAWLLLWIPSFFVSVKLALMIPAAWIAYVLIQYERRTMKLKSQATSAA